MPFKRTLGTCATALMLLSIGSTSANAASVKPNHSGRTSQTVRHLGNVKRAAQMKSTHARNVRRINRIKRHLISHQKNLIRISNRLNRMKRHHRNVNLINRLNNDKARLIKMIENNERGMVCLAQTVAGEEHQINLLRHPNRTRVPNQQTTRNSSPANQSSTQVKLLQPSSSSNYRVGRSVMTFINEVNGKLTKYAAKDSGFTNQNGRYNSRSYSDINGHYSASPSQITQNEINQLNQQVQSQIQNSNRWFKEVQQDMNQEFNLWF